MKEPVSTVGEEEGAEDRDVAAAASGAGALAGTIAASSFFFSLPLLLTSRISASAYCDPNQVRMLCKNSSFLFTTLAAGVVEATTAAAIGVTTASLEEEEAA